jgi:hypothetical protein
VTAIRAAFTAQAAACASLGSPFMAQLMRLCATQVWPAGAVTSRIHGWTGDLGPSGQSVPLRLAGALHALQLQGHARLTPVYPPHSSDDAALWAAVADVLALGGQVFGPATPALTLSPDWTGTLPPDTRPQVTARAGVDLTPLDPHTPDDALRLRAYLWPDQPDRKALTQAAIATARTTVAKGDAIDWLAGQLDHQQGQTHLIYTTIAWQYFPAAAQDRGTAMISAAGRTAHDDAPLAWFGMEPDGAGPGAALTLRLWPGDLTFALGRADFHGRWVQWAPVQINQKD